MKQNRKKRAVFFLTALVLAAVVITLTTVHPKEWDVFSGQLKLPEETKSNTEPLLFLIKRDYVVNKNGEKVKAVRLPVLEDGDVLVTDATFCFGWRHGHAAIVVDAKRGRTLEAYSVGTTSDFDSVGQWEYYPRVLVLRLRASKEVRRQIAEFARTELVGIPYRLCTGMIDDKDMKGDYWGTQCAHLVWLAFYRFGYDVDGDGGWLVTPYDLAGSELFETVPVKTIPLSFSLKCNAN